MHTGEFDLCHGMINVPEEYHDLETSHIKVIAIIDDENVRTTTRDNLNAFRRMQIMAVNHPLAMLIPQNPEKQKNAITVVEQALTGATRP